jgi:F0F1-type ATP synthase delta subunit
MAKIGRRRLARELVRLLNEQLNEQPDRKSVLLQMTAAYLVQTKQVNQAHLLINDIAEEILSSAKHLNANAYSAFELTDGSRQQIVDLLKEATGASSVELQEQLKPELIGGVVLTTPTMQLDASVVTRIKQIAGGTK